MPTPTYNFRNRLSYIGIDPGKQGGLVCLQYRSHKPYEHVEVIATPMPGTLIDVRDWFRAIPSGTRVAVIEKVRSSPQMGNVSAFTFGRGYGDLEMALAMVDISFQEVRPQDWQSELGIPKRKKGRQLVEGKTNWLESAPQFKQRLRDVAQKLFPDLHIWNEPKSKGKQLAIADALLIAEFCRRRNN